MSVKLSNYTELLHDVKGRIRRAQQRAVVSVNTEMIMLYFDIGRLIESRQQAEGWGTAVIPRLALDLKNELPDEKGFSERNLKRMVAFYREYEDRNLKVPQPVAQLQSPENEEQTSPLPSFLFQIPWSHHILLMEKVKDLDIRFWYMEQTIAQGWSRNVLLNMIKNRDHERRGKAATNFAVTLPAGQSDLAQQTLKDPYIFDFLTLESGFREQELELELVRHLEKFLLELGKGFAFVGRQYQLSVGSKDYFLDLLFYSLELRCFLVIDLKIGEFKPEYAGKMTFYCNAVDNLLKHETDQPTIGLILCREKDRILVEYSLRDVNKPIGVSEYELTQTLPDEFKSALPSIEQIEAELQGE